jgi:DNA processing protein
MINYKYWIALEQTKGIGTAHLGEIYDALSSKNLSIDDLFGLTPQEIKAELYLKDAIADAVTQAKARLDAIEQEYISLLDIGAEILMFFEENYPARLRKILKNTCPPVIYIYGNKSLLRTRAAAILGDKNISEKGELITYSAASELVRHQITLISGFARGAGLIAHRAAIEKGGNTIAVLPYGFSHLQVPDMLKDILNMDKILFVSPFSYTREFSQYSAMHRNRIICAMSHAVYIVESPLEGGIFEAGKSASNLGIPLYVTQYANYPDSAAGNPKLISELGANPVRGRMLNNQIAPNMDRLIGDVKFKD